VSNEISNKSLPPSKIVLGPREYMVNNASDTGRSSRWRRRGRAPVSKRGAEREARQEGFERGYGRKVMSRVWPRTLIFKHAIQK